MDRLIDFLDVLAWFGIAYFVFNFIIGTIHNMNRTFSVRKGILYKTQKATLKTHTVIVFILGVAWLVS